MERESLAFHRAVRDVYLRLLDRNPDRIVRIDAALPEEAVRARVREAVAARFGW
jgi:thymidylate kinase